MTERADKIGESRAESITALRAHISALHLELDAAGDAGGDAAPNTFTELEAAQATLAALEAAA